MYRLNHPIHLGSVSIFMQLLQMHQRYFHRHYYPWTTLISLLLNYSDILIISTYSVHLSATSLDNYLLKTLQSFTKSAWKKIEACTVMKSKALFIVMVMFTLRQESLLEWICSWFIIVNTTAKLHWNLTENKDWSNDKPNSI